jgi:hypothetical protein
MLVVLQIQTVSAQWIWKEWEIVMKLAAYVANVKIMLCIECWATVHLVKVTVTTDRKIVFANYT